MNFKSAKKSFSLPNYSAIFSTTFLAYVLFSPFKLEKKVLKPVFDLEGCAWEEEKEVYYKYICVLMA